LQCDSTAGAMWHGVLFIMCLGTLAKALVALPVVDSSVLLGLWNAALQTLDGGAEANTKLSVALLIFAIFGFVAMSDDFQTIAEEEDEMVQQQMSSQCIDKNVATPDVYCGPTSIGMLHGLLCMLCLATLSMVLNIVVPAVSPSMPLDLWSTAVQTLDGTCKDTVKLSVLLLIFVIFGFAAMSDDFHTLSEEEEEKAAQQGSPCTEKKEATSDLCCNSTSFGMFHGWPCMLCAATLTMVLVAAPMEDSSTLLEVWNTVMQSWDGAAEDNMKISAALLVFAALGFAAVSDDFQTLAEEEDDQLQQQASARNNEKAETPDLPCNPTSLAMPDGCLCMLYTATLAIVPAAVSVVHSSMLLKLWNAALQALNDAAGDNIKLAVALLIFAIFGLVTMSDDFQTLAEDEDEHVEQQVSAGSKQKVARVDVKCTPTSPGVFPGWVCMLCLAALVPVAMTFMHPSELLELWNTTLQTLSDAALNNAQITFVLVLFVGGGIVAIHDDFNSLAEEEEEQKTSVDDNESCEKVRWPMASACLVLLLVPSLFVATKVPEQLQAALCSGNFRGLAMVAAVLSLAAAGIRTLEPMLKGSKESLSGRGLVSGAQKLVQ